MGAVRLLGLDESGDPPTLQWWWVILLTFLSFGAFGPVWLVLQALWIRRVSGRWLGMALAVVLAAMGVWFAIVQASAGFAGLFHQQDSGSGWYWVLWVATVYTMRWELQQEPIGFRLGWFMPFFFGPVYFQYRLGDWGMGRESGRPLGLSR